MSQQCYKQTLATNTSPAVTHNSTITNAPGTEANTANTV